MKYIILLLSIIFIFFYSKKYNFIEKFSIKNLPKIGIQTVFILKENIIFLEEWIKHHKNLGFSKFYLYDNTGSRGHASSNKHKNKYNIYYHKIINLKKNEEYTILKKILKKYPEITYVKWQPKNKKKKIIYGQGKSINHYIKNYGTECDWTLFTDIDEFVISKKNINISKYINYLDKKGITKIFIRQKKFGDRFCYPLKKISQITDCVVNIDTKTWAPKNFVKNSSVITKKPHFIHDLSTKGKQKYCKANMIRFNHYNINKKQIIWMKNYYNKTGFNYSKDFSLKKYNKHLKNNNLRYLNKKYIRQNKHKYCINF
jgi:hypothetical protein